MTKLPHFKGVVDNLNLGVIFLDEMSNIIYLNSWIESVADCDFDEVSGQCFEDVFFGINKTRVWEAVSDALIFGLASYISASFNSTPFIFYKRGFFGVEYYRIRHSVSVQPLLFPDGSQGCEILIEDVSVAKEKESSLKQMSVNLSAAAAELAVERDHLATIFNNTANAIISFYENGKIDTVNRAASDVFGYSGSEIRSMNFQNLFMRPESHGENVSPSVLVLFQQMMGESKVGGPAFISNTIAFKKDGSVINIELRIGRSGSSGRGNAIAIIRDTTEQVVTQVTLADSERRFKTLAKMAPVGIFYTDTYGRFRYVNEMWVIITGNSLKSLENKQWLDVVHSVEKEVVTAQWKMSKQNNGPFSAEFRIECGLNVVWVLCRIVAETDVLGDITGYVGTITDVSVQHESRNQIEKLAFYDPLTALANRRLFRDRLEQGLANISRTGKSLALLNLDLDNFKRINDSLGHDVGDLLLSSIAERLTACVRKNDTVARLGGDEFVIILSNIESDEVVGIIAEKIIKVLREPIQLPGQDIKMTASMGVALAPCDGADVQTLVKNADIAMYNVKALGRNKFGFFTPEMNERVVSRLALETELQTALDQQQFFLAYQPQYSIDGNSFVGMEALIRWQHPERGEVSPDQFIEVAESTGQIVDIGEWVLERACADMRRLLDLSLVRSDSRVCVNLSAKQFLDPKLPYVVQQALMSSGLKPGNLELEITESMLMENIDEAVRLVKCLKGFGVYFSIDDFGTGYSSLGYLKRLPVDTLKIDRCFINDLVFDEQDKGIVSAVIILAHKLNLKVVAEGIELGEQLDFLKVNGCDYAQGYLLSKPLPFSSIVENICKGGVTISPVAGNDAQYLNRSGSLGA
ncbi:MAG: EAL domain-containing protein [Proteobacteria bacterium]|nr:EAL domain-containing protein [Pseudomonadota bacterium]